MIRRELGQPGTLLAVDRQPRARIVIGCVLLALVALSACAAAQESVQGLRDRISGIDIDSALEGLRDCSRMSEGFVGVVQQAADAIDGLAETSNGRVPATDIRNAIDSIAVSRYFEIAERIGCAELQQRVTTLERLRDVAPDTPAGSEFLDEIISQVESAG